MATIGVASVLLPLPGRERGGNNRHGLCAPPFPDVSAMATIGVVSVLLLLPDASVGAN